MRRWILLLLTPTTLFAQTNYELGEVTVTDNRLETPLMQSGRNVQVITQQQIAQLPVQHVNELLQHVAGIDLRQRGAWGAQADISLRGGTFDQCLVLVNGIKVNDPQTGHHNLNLGIDLSAIKQVEVIKGPAAARYGLNAFSGVINIITEPSSSSMATVGSSIGQSYNSRLPDAFYGAYDVQGSVHVATGRTKHMISGSRTQSTGYRPNTDLGRHALFYQSQIESRAGEFDVMGSYVRNDFGASGFYAFPIDSTSEERVETYLAALQHFIQKGAFQFRTKAYFRQNHDTYTLFREAPSIYQNRHRTDVSGAEFHANYSYAIGTVGIGLEWRQEVIESTNLGDWTRNNAGLFAENRLWIWNERIALNTGFYLNQSNTFGTQFLPAASLNYQIKPGINAFASWGQSFRVPTFTDLYYVGPTNIGNPDLKPEQSNSYEAGLKWNKEVHHVQISAFNQRSTNLVDWVRDSINHPWQPRNYDDVISNGMECNYEIRARKQWTPWLTWDMARLGYTWLDMQIESDGELISRYALSNLRHQLTAQTAFSFSEKVMLTLTGRYMDRQAYTSYWLVDVRLGYKSERFNVWADCTNLLDTEYVEAANAIMPGRWFRLGFDATLR